MLNPNVILISSLLLMGIGVILIIILNRRDRPRSGNADGQKTPAQDDRFVDEFRFILADVFPGERFSYNWETDTFLQIANGNPNTDGTATDGIEIFLGNLRNRTLEMGAADRKEFLINFLQQATQNTEITAELVKEKMVMRCRTQEEFARREFQLNLKTDNKFEPLILSKGEMQFEPVLDFNDSVMAMNSENMRDTGFKYDEFIQLAGQNLLNATPQNSSEHWEKLEDHIWISQLNDDFDAARVFLFPEHISFPFKDAPVVYAPSHAICLISPKTDEATLARMVELGDESAQTHRQLSRALWQEKDGQWQRLNSTNRLSIAGRTRLIEYLIDYGDQKDSLEQFFENSNLDIHVAAVLTREISIEDKLDRIETVSVFIGQHSYLPKTDFVVLGLDPLTPDDDAKEIAWDTFTDIIGEENMTSHPDLKPVRYMFEDAIPEEKIQALIVASTSLS